MRPQLAYCKLQRRRPLPPRLLALRRSKAPRPRSLRRPTRASGRFSTQPKGTTAAPLCLLDRSPHVFSTSLVRARKFYGFHGHESLFIRVALINPNEVSPRGPDFDVLSPESLPPGRRSEAPEQPPGARSSRQVSSAAEACATGLVLGRRFAVHESHVNFVQQLMARFFSFFHSFIHFACALLLFRRPRARLPRNPISPPAATDSSSQIDQNLLGMGLALCAAVSFRPGIPDRPFQRDRAQEDYGVDRSPVLSQEPRPGAVGVDQARMSSQAAPFASPLYPLRFAAARRDAIARRRPPARAAAGVDPRDGAGGVAAAPARPGAAEHVRAGG